MEDAQDQFNRYRSRFIAGTERARAIGSLQHEGDLAFYEGDMLVDGVVVRIVDRFPEEPTEEQIQARIILLREQDAQQEANVAAHLLRVAAAVKRLEALALTLPPDDADAVRLALDALKDDEED